MKKILSIILLCFCFSLNAQDNSDYNDHMTFKQVPINGTLSDYVDKMQKSGFTLFGTENNIAILKGDFAGYKSCFIGVSTLEQKDLVNKINVIFPECDTWSTLSSNYFNLKELLTEKYGPPSETREKFDTYSKPDDDGSKMYAVKFDNCKYSTTYETQNGSIHLTIDHEGVSSCFVRLSYFDKKNSEIIREKAKGDL